jgi:GntR family transcriptional regulator
MTDFEPILRDANRRLSAELRATGQSVWEVDADGRRVDVLDLAVGYWTASKGVADSLGTASTVLRDRVYAVDGRRVCWALSWLPARLATGTPIEQADTGPGGTPACLAELGHGLVSFVENVEFVEREDVTAEERDRLGIDDMTAVVRIVRRSATAEGRVVEVTDMRLIASAYRFRWGWANR